MLVQYLLAGGTSDDHVWDMLARKLNVLAQVGLASASDQSFRDAHKEYQQVVGMIAMLAFGVFFSRYRRSVRAFFFPRDGIY